MIEGKTSGGFQPGQRVGGGRYTLLRELGRGGMGVVWLARDSRLQEEVALKFIPPEVRTDAATLDDLRRETLKSRRLSHPNIIRIHDLFESPDEPPFISMEFIDGVPLNKLKAEQPQRLFEWEYLKPLVKQLCDGLEYAHSQKVIHRDLKPGNMMVTGEGVLKLADFGLAASVSDSISRMSQHLGSSGTPAYMSPQQMRSQAPRVSDDIYALGATLYELLTSKPPFYTGDIYRQVKEEPAVPLEERLADLELTNVIPPDVSALIMACLAKEPEQRPQSAAAVAEWIGLNVCAVLSPLASQVFQPDDALGMSFSKAGPSQEHLPSPYPPESGVETVAWWRVASRILAAGAVIGLLLWVWFGNRDSGALGVAAPSTTNMTTVDNSKNLMVTKEDFLGRRFRFSWRTANKSAIIGSLKLLADGRIEGSSSPNESRWELRGTTLVFKHQDGKVSTVFDSLRRTGGKWLLEGEFRFELGVRHLLEEE